MHFPGAYQAHHPKLKQPKPAKPKQQKGMSLLLPERHAEYEHDLQSLCKLWTPWQRYLPEILLA